MPMARIAYGADWTIRLTKLPAVRKFEFWRLEDDRDDDQADDDRQRPELALLDVRQPAAAVVAEAELRALLRRRARAAAAVRDGAHASHLLGLAGNRRQLPGGDRFDDLLLVGLAALELGDVLAEAQHGDRVGDLEDVVQVVGDQDHGEALLAEALDEVQHLPRLRDAERRGRLVEDHDPRVPHHRLGDGDGLALAAGEPGDGLAHGADGRHREASTASCSRAPPCRPRRGGAGRRVSSRPRNMFCTTSRLSASARSW